MDIRERMDDSSERRNVIVLGLAPPAVLHKQATSNKQGEYPQADRGGGDTKDPDNDKNKLCIRHAKMPLV